MIPTYDYEYARAFSALFAKLQSAYSEQGKLTTKKLHGLSKRGEPAAPANANGLEDNALLKVKLLWKHSR